MFNFITRNFSSIRSLITAPFRASWGFIVSIFPERDFTIMDTPHGNVYSFHQSSFWRFTKFCGKVGLVIWASWSTYVFVYHRPLLQKRTQQLEEYKEIHARQISDMLTYLKKYNELARNLNIIDYKVLTSKKLSDNEKDSLMKKRVNTWGELDFLQTRLTSTFSDIEYVPEFKKLSELSVEYDLIRSENDELKKQNQELTESMITISDADNQIVGVVTKLTKDKTEDLRNNLKKIKGTIINLGLNENVMIERANKFSNQLVGSAFVPLELDSKLDPKYQKLADSLKLWSGLSRLNTMLPMGAPVDRVRITSTFGTRTDPFDGSLKKHKGLDFAGKIGTELYAIAPGRIVSAGERVGYGKTVEVDHGLGFSTLYAHLSRINVTRGDWVRPGSIVGLAGSSGRSTGPHLHYEIRYNGVPFDPSKFVKE
ncbi:MAG: peptidoglycan DD-metalloendopeptidase family protein [Alphaproteobacteria bacterium]|nr:peptidoglycan DD-metalloendopeptidase family protein [Alphaproteobacteria bacterium]MBN2674987.1 peptidoglycan DD-metalloendopeptidase family protein [Alphaproteobacteria bacterium]